MRSNRARINRTIQGIQKRLLKSPIWLKFECSTTLKKLKCLFKVLFCSGNLEKILLEF